MKPISKGSIVKYKDGNYRVSACFSKTVNLSGVFSSHIHHKGIPLSEVVEDEEEWYKRWTQSESYKSM